MLLNSEGPWKRRLSAHQNSSNVVQYPQQSWSVSMEQEGRRKNKRTPERGRLFVNPACLEKSLLWLSIGVKSRTIVAKKTVQKDKEEKDDVSHPTGDFETNPKYYEQIDSFEVYATEKKITKMFGVKNIGPSSHTEPYLKSQTKYKSPYGWKYAYGIDLHLASQVARFIHGLLALARRLGWQIKQAENLEQIKSQLRESEEVILRLESSNAELRGKHEELMIVFRAKQEAELRSRVQQFEDDIAALEELLTKAGKGEVAEQELQDFLYAHPWLFGTEYISAEPQKFRGAHSKFDFYLERFNKTNDIVEIKLLSSAIIIKDGSISAGVTQAVDQLIGYMESTQAAAHSTTISEEEGIRELRPRGIVIIGSDNSNDAKKKLFSWNYQFAHITILTYRDVLERAKAVLGHLKEHKAKEQ